MQFSDVVAPAEHLNYLQHAVEQETLPHAMLFWGQEGSGKLATSLALAQYLMCKDKQNGSSCGKCSNCVKNAKFIHPDVHYVFPIVKVGDKTKSTDFYPEWRQAIGENPYMSVQDWGQHLRSENKQLNIAKSECTRIIQQLSLKSFEGSYKLLIVWMAEYLGKEANRWLKLIEEPADDTIIVLMVEDRNAVLPTILSRCQQFHFGPVPSSVIIDRLQHLRNVDDVQAARIASASHGSWNMAMKIAENKQFNPVSWMEEWVKLAWENNPAHMRKWSEDMSRFSREENKQYQRYVIEVLQKLYWIKWGIDFEADLEEKTMLNSLNKKIEFNELEDLVRLSENNLRALMRNGRPNMIWMDATLKLRTALKNYHGQIGVQL